ncbi:MAG: oligosaccharide flippase family protein [Victivallales bacterium]|nr:oligosaccharide flippase family protein [Victivallales bacterium]
MTAKNKNHLVILLQGTIISLIGTVVLGLGNFLIRRHLQGNLPPRDFGFLYAAFSLVTVFLALLDFGLGQSGTIMMSRRFTAGDNDRAERIYSLMFYLKLGCGIAMFLLFLIFAPLLVNYYYRYPSGLTAFILVALLLIFQSLETCPAAVMDSLKAFGLKNLLQSLKVVAIFMAVWLLIPRFGIDVAAGIFSAASLLALAVSLLALRRWKRIRLQSWSRLKRDDALDMWRLCRWVALGAAGMTLIGNADTLLLTWLRGLVEVGIYNVALAIAQIVQLLSVLPIVFTPIVAELWHHRAEAEIGRICALMTTILFIIFWAVLIGTVLLGGDVLELAFNTAARAGAAPLLVLCAAAPLLAAANFFLSALNAGRGAGKAAALIAVGVVADLVLNLLLIPPFGLVGAALATTLSYGVIAAMSFSALRRELPSLSLPRRDLIMTGIAGALGLGAAIPAARAGWSIAANFGMAAGLLLVYTGLVAPVWWRLYRQARRYLGGGTTAGANKNG